MTWGINGPQFGGQNSQNISSSGEMIIPPNNYQALLPGMSVYGQQYNPMGYGMGFPPSPFEITNAQLYQQQESIKGMLSGGAIGGIVTGAVAGFKIGSATFNPLAAVGGAVVGAVAGGIIGKFTGEQKAINRDARDDFRINGSPMFYGHNRSF